MFKKGEKASLQRSKDRIPLTGIRNPVAQRHVPGLSPHRLFRIRPALVVRAIKHFYRNDLRKGKPGSMIRLMRRKWPPSGSIFHLRLMQPMRFRTDLSRGVPVEEILAGYSPTGTTIIGVLVGAGDPPIGSIETATALV
jgi:hypothetical protein